MDPAIVITLCVSVCGVIFASITAPIILLRRTEAQHTADRNEDWARQDAAAAALKEAQDAQAEATAEVARRAAQAALDLTASQKATADALIKANNLTNGKLDTIHTLVNSNMTAAMQAEFDATVRELAMMREVIALKQAAGQQPSVDSLAAIDATQSKISELTAALADRARAVVQAQTADEEAR